MLKIEKVSKSFGGLKALQSVNIEISQGEILGLIGPNGAGKTTLFNIISGLMEPNEGRILFLEEDITGLKPHQICNRGLARTFQIVRPFRKLTVAENLMIGALNRIGKVQEAKERVTQALKFVALERKSYLLAENLNIPELKRLELAKALATEPKLLMLDEVMAGLNAVEQNHMIELVRKIQERGICVLIIEHIMKTIMALSHRIVVLHHGIKIADGKPREISKNERVIEAYLGEEI